MTKKIFVKENIKYIPLLLAGFLIIYPILCYMIIDFSLIIMLYFIGLAVLNILLFYTLAYPINYKERGPSFLHIFIKVSYVFAASFTVILILINIFIPKPTIPPNQKYQYMVVFGANVSVDERKNYVLNKRIEKAVEYYKKDNNIIFVLSGGKGENELLEEATYMKEYMMSKGVRKEKILIDIFSTNTYENISNSLSIIESDIIKRNKYESFLNRPISTRTGKYDLEQINIGFISSDFHMWRITMMAKRSGIKKPFNVPVATRPFYLLFYYMRENLSLFKAFLLGELKL